MLFTAAKFKILLFEEPLISIPVLLFAALIFEKILLFDDDQTYIPRWLLLEVMIFDKILFEALSRFTPQSGWFAA